MESATSTFGRFIVDTSYEKLPEEVIFEAKKRIADVLGICLSGAATQAKKIIPFCLQNGGPGSATIWGSGKKTAPAFAALANGTMTFHLELDDVHRTSHTHPGVSCIPAAIALGESFGSSGRELIEAVVIGYDASIRVGMTVSPSIYVDRTYLAPGTLSPFGAAASAAKLMKLDADKAGRALGAVSYFGPLACYESFKLGADVKDMISAVSLAQNLPQTAAAVSIPPSRAHSGSAKPCQPGMICAAFMTASGSIMKSCPQASSLMHAADNTMRRSTVCLRCGSSTR